MRQKQTKGYRRDKRCLFPAICPSLKINHSPLIGLLETAAQHQQHQKNRSGLGHPLRHDPGRQKHGLSYLREVVRHHVSGQMKIAPEHSESEAPHAMGKTGHRGPAAVLAACSID